jgi:hypothetical protein
LTLLARFAASRLYKAVSSSLAGSLISTKTIEEKLGQLQFVLVGPAISAIAARATEFNID